MSYKKQQQPSNNMTRQDQPAAPPRCTYRRGRTTAEKKNPIKELPERHPKNITTMSAAGFLVVVVVVVIGRAQEFKPGYDLLKGCCLSSLLGDGGGLSSRKHFRPMNQCRPPSVSVTDTIQGDDGNDNELRERWWFRITGRSLIVLKFSLGCFDEETGANVDSILG